MMPAHVARRCQQAKRFSIRRLIRPRTVCRPRRASISDGADQNPSSSSASYTALMWSAGAPGLSRKLSARHRTTLSQITDARVPADVGNPLEGGRSRMGDVVRSL